jgi:DNA-binding MarR family transcriptional regulator
MLQVDAALAERTGIRLLTPEARILFQLMTAGPMSVTTAMQVAGVSYRGFYAVLDRLKKAGLIASAKNTEDQRVRTLKVDFPAPAPSAAD